MATMFNFRVKNVRRVLASVLVLSCLTVMFWTFVVQDHVNNTDDYVLPFKVRKRSVSFDTSREMPLKQPVKESLEQTNVRILSKNGSVGLHNEVISRFKNFKFNRTAFGDGYTLNNERSSEYDFSFIINGSGICDSSETPLLVIMVPSVHTKIDLRAAIRSTYGRAARERVWPKVGHLKQVVKLVFLFGTSGTRLGNNIAKMESAMYNDVVQGDFVDSYFNLTYKSVMGVRWMAEFCPRAKCILKADDDVFVHVKNLIDFLEKAELPERGIVYGHKLVDSKVLRTGRWAVSNTAFPPEVYPPYTCGNTYVISGNIADVIFYTAGLLPYHNIEDVFVTGVVREFIGAEIQDVVGFTHWYEKRPRPCEFKNKKRISATKVTEPLLFEIFEGLRSNLSDCYVYEKRQSSKLARPERKLTYSLIKDNHVFYNESSRKFYIL